MVRARLAAAAIAVGLLAPAAAAAPVCTMTNFRLVAVGGSGTGLAMGAGAMPCWGPYVFYGVTPTGLGFPRATVDDAAELAAALRAWTPADGAPPVDAPVNLSPGLWAAFSAAGIDPVRFLQWLNEYDGAGTVGAPAMPPAWPSFLPRGLVADPRRIVGASGGAPRVPENSGPVPGSPPAEAGATAAHAAAAPVPSRRAGPVAPSSTARSAPAGPAPGVPLPEAGASPVALARAATPPRPAAPPPAAVDAGGRRLPCAAVPRCADRLRAWEAFRGLPWYRRVLLESLSHPWRAAAVGALAAAVAGLAVAGCAFVRRRRNRLWYGRAAGPS